MKTLGSRTLVSAALGILLATVVRGASAGVILEIGDAGQTIATAQVVAGSSSVGSISGSFASASDVDLYKIHITNPTLFSATASSSPFGDGMLFLFNSSGIGVVMRDDTVDRGGNYGPLTSAFVLSAGDYFLGISLFDMVPSSLGGKIFPDTETVNSGIEYGPTGPGGASPLNSWGAGAGGLSGGPATYTIVLTSVSGVPEPTTLALLSLGLAGLAATRRRKQ